MKHTVSTLKGFNEPHLTSLREAVVKQLLQTMLMFGVKKVDFNPELIGGIHALSPKVMDMEEAAGARPEALTRVRNTVLHHAIRGAFVFGVTGVDMTPSSEEIAMMFAAWSRKREEPPMEELT